MQTALKSRAAAEVLTQFLHARCETLQHYSISLRKQSRDLAADAKQSREESRELVKQWREVLAKSKELSALVRMTKERQTIQSAPLTKPSQTTPTISAAVGTEPSPSNVSVSVACSPTPRLATARRLPWRRMQMEDLDDTYQLWVSPDEARPI